MTLIKDLIDIPRQVQDGDFVLKLTQGITEDAIKTTVDQYVVTPQLAQSFDEALGLVASAVSSGDSKAAFLQGSFGSGKSHFMAVLHLLLQNNTHARSKPELHDPISKWDNELSGKKFLLVPSHFLDAKSMEQRILGGYVELIRKEHPDAPLPAVFLGDTIVATELPGMRHRLGDEAFLKGLNDVSGNADDWGDFASSWTHERLNAAIEAPATDDERQELVRAYVAAFRPATVLESVSSGEGFVDLDRGLGAISRHAQTLGYAGIVLFLDELILWLASNIGNIEFVNRESQKLTKLVEATEAGRPVPIISLIARQRDLQDLVGNNIAGNEFKSFADSLAHQSGRFSEVKLASGNLPAIASKRLLVPVDAAAAAVLSSSVDAALVGRDDVARTLLGSEADLDLFRTVYPFSPALVNTLVDVSEALQRERTALKVMLQLLVDRRDTLKVGQIIPVGDLWDVVSERDEPFSNELKALFEMAKKLWRRKLEPALKSMNRVDDDTPEDSRNRKALENDSRLVKTIMLAALVPEVEAFRGLDVAKLAALNWGTIDSPIARTENVQVLRKLRELSTTVGELTIGEDPVNPTINLVLANVDTDDIVNRAITTYDSPGTRSRTIKDLIGKALSFQPGEEIQRTIRHQWRGTDRPFELVFGNIRDKRDLSDEALAASVGTPKIVIDYPFDEQGRTPEDDLERLDAWSNQHNPSQTICWLPSFFNTQGVEALRRFVAIDEVLKGARFEGATQQLSASQRAEAKPILQSQHRELESQLDTAIRSAYGLGLSSRFVDEAHSLTDHYRSLDPSISLRPVSSAGLSEALGQLCDQVLESIHPQHPKFVAKVTKAHLATTWDQIRRALADEDRRVNVEKTKRKAVENVVKPLGLGEMYESHFVLEGYWQNQLDRHLAAAKSEGQDLSVRRLREIIETTDATSRGLFPATADLIIMTVAGQADHALRRSGLHYEPNVGTAMPDDVTLVPEELPSAQDWEAAVARSGAVFGIAAQPRVNGPELASFVRKISDAAAGAAVPASELARRLGELHHKVNVPTGSRFESATAAHDLVAKLDGAQGMVVIQLLANFQTPTSDQAIATSLSSAEQVSKAIEQVSPDLFVGAHDHIGDEFTELLQTDEVALKFGDQSRKLGASAAKWLATKAAASAPAVAESVVQGAASNLSASGVSVAATELADVLRGPSPSASHRIVTSASDLAELTKQLGDALETGPITVSWEPKA